MGFKDFFKQIAYTIKSEDRYADYDSQLDTENNTFNNSSEDGRRDSFQLGAVSDDSDAIQHSTEGVSDTIVAWRNIDQWLQDNHVDLYSSISDPCTRADVAKAEKDLGVTFPPSLRASLRIHDGQEDMDRLAGTGGVIFGLRLLPLAEIVAMTQTWRRVAYRMSLEAQSKQQQAAQQSKSDALISPIGSSADLLNGSENTSAPQNNGNKLNSSFKKGLPKQRSLPQGCVKTEYATNGWIPLAIDDSGNNIGVDLNPDVNGTYGQVITFGREFDTKFVVASNWGEFLTNFYNDLNAGNYLIHDSDDYYTQDGDLAYFDPKLRTEVAYLQALSRRVIAKYGEKKPAPTAVATAPTTSASTTNANANASNTNAAASSSTKPEEQVSHILPKTRNQTETKQQDVKSEVKEDVKEDEDDEDDKGEQSEELTKENVTVEEDLLDKIDDEIKNDQIRKTSIVQDFENVSLN